MRNFLDNILIFLSLPSLTDDEFSALNPVPVTQDYTSVSYTALDNVLKDREDTLLTRERLKDYFTAKGVELVDPTYVAASNILVGVALD